MRVYDIKDPQFLKALSIKELETLSQEIRAFLIESVAKTGGHLSSNLGVVEATIALHKVFDSPTDRIVFDVGHQAYTHKILTGRAKQFDQLRKTDGLSGFLKRQESPHDCYESGHSSTSLAAGAGLLYAKELGANLGHVVMFIGDGALASGPALEALNFIGHDHRKNAIIVLNDNEMSISKNIGHLSKFLTKLRMRKSLRKLRTTTRKFIPKPFVNLTLKVEKRVKGFISGHSYFEDIGYRYYGPIDGHDFKSLLKVFEIAKSESQPCIVHLRTQKGRGYALSENDQIGSWHGVGPFDIETGEPLKVNNGVISYSRAVSEYLLQKAAKERFYVITPAMVSGSELGEFQAQYPERFIDVGIAEQTAITMATGLGLEKIKVFVSIYSTFLQRAYDALIHDLARHNVNAVIGIDRAGIVGADGETHQGIYDIPLLMHIPHLTIAHAKDFEELYAILNYAFDVHQGVIAVRYPREFIAKKTLDIAKIKPLKPSWDVLHKGEAATIITFGSIVDELKKAVDKENLPITLINARYLRPLDENILNSIDRTVPILIAEESTLNGGLGASIISYFSDHDLTFKTIKRIGFSNQYVPQGDRETMLKRYQLDAQSILEAVKKLYAS